jgi:acetyl-CoA acetyltransferase family protein
VSSAPGPAFLVDAVRTPVGRHGGALAGVRPDDLAATTVAALVARSPDLDPARIDDVILGDANQAGEDNRDVARMAVLLAGLPVTVPGTTVNRLCGSGLEAVVQAARAVETGDADVVVAGGVESMSRAPWVLAKPERPYARGHETLHSTTLGWRLVNPAMPQPWTVALGEATEIIVAEFGIPREAQDEFALASHRRAAAAWEAGGFADEVVAVPGVDLPRDESIRPDTSLAALSRLRPVFRPDGTVTAGNSSPLNDGASAVLVCSEAGVAATGREPLARIRSRAAVGVEPHRFGIGPVGAARVALDRAGVSWADLAAVELNEAFAGQSLACLSQWPDLNPAVVNSRGGAIAVGHALGSSGSRILTTLAWRLRHAGGGVGLVAICIGVGQGLAMVVEA